MTQKAIITDLNRCTGCLSCTVACKLINDVPVGNFWVRTLRVGPVPKAGGTGDFPDVDMYYLPVQCQHCANPECVEVCPTGALVAGREREHPKKQWDVRNKDLIVQKLRYEEVGANSWVTSESDRPLKRVNGGDL